MNTDLQKLLLATTALRDIEMGYPHREIGATQGGGRPALLRELVTYLDERGALSASEREIFGEALPDVEWKPSALLPQFEPFRLVLASFALGEGDSPRFVEIEVTPALLSRMQSLQEALRAHGIWVAMENWDAEWDSLPEDLRMENTVLGLNGDGVFFLEATPRDADYACQTHGIKVESLLAAMAQRGNGESNALAPLLSSAFQWRQGVLFHTPGARDLQELIDGWLEWQAEAAEAASVRPRG